MVIALSDHPQVQLCPARQRQSQAPSHHLHTALEWGQCPPQRGWEKPLSWGHLLGDRGLSEPHKPLSSQEGTRGSTALGQVGDLLSVQKRADFPVCSKLGRFLAVLSLTLLVPHLFRVPPCPSCPMQGDPWLSPLSPVPPGGWWLQLGPRHHAGSEDG